jgi:hypothetical protein
MVSVMMVLAALAGAGPTVALPGPSGIWSAWAAVPGDEEAASAPAAVTYGTRFFVFFRSGGGRIWYTSKGPVNWSAWKQVPGTQKARSNPAVVVSGSKLWLFVRGSDNAIHRNVFDGSTWGGWRLLPGGGLTTASPAAVIQGGQLFLFVRGTDDRIFVDVKSASGWSGWSEVPGNGRMYHAPAAAVDQNGMLHLIVRGFENRLYAATRSSVGAWTAWTEIYNGIGVGDPAMATLEGVPYVFMRGSDSKVKWAARYPLDYWTWGYPNPDGTIDSSPGAAVQGERLWLVARDAGAGISRSRYTPTTP